jgi:hypothetical protein
MSPTPYHIRMAEPIVVALEMSQASVSACRFEKPTTARQGTATTSHTGAGPLHFESIGSTCLATTGMGFATASGVTLAAMDVPHTPSSMCRCSEGEWHGPTSS